MTMRIGRLGSVAFVSLVANVALAQAPGPQAPAPAAPPAAPPPAAPAPGGPPGSVIIPGQGGSVIITPGTSTTVGPPAAVDPNSSLPSSSRPKLGDERDGFDLNQPSSGGGGVVFGNKGASAVTGESGVSGGGARPVVPEIHLVRRGDTLWDLCDHYYSNPWQWPRVWSYNPQVANPHWIYPGDQIRMLGPGGAGGGASIYERLGRGGPGGAGKGSGAGGGGSGIGRGSKGGGRIAPNTVILRDQGFIGDPEKDNWGEVAGSQDEQMMLTDGNRVYLLMKSGKTVKPKDELTLYRSVRQPSKVKGARKPPGEIVAVLGTVRIESFDPNTRIAKGSIVESIDVIERGAKVGPVGRRFEIAPPLPSQANVQARVLTSLYPHLYVAQNQVVFIDRGSEDGLRVGNRLLVVRRGDTWRATLENATRDRVRMDSPENAEVEKTPLVGEQDKFPEEAVAELRVLRADKWSSLALVTQSRREVVSGDLAVTRKGF
jgi:hypothetical protein